MEQQDIRWKQRFQNFDKAFLRLSKAMLIIREDPDNFLLQAGLIQIYEFTFELSWKTLKDYLEAEGFTCPSPRATLRQAFQSGYIQEGDLWLQALNDRNLTTHTYDEETALSVANNIQTSYFPLLKALHTWLEIQSHDRAYTETSGNHRSDLFPISACRGSNRIRFEGQRQLQTRFRYRYGH